MKEETAIKRYKEYNLNKLMEIAVKNFHAWIRERDKDLGCISCSTGKPEQAGHYLSAGHHAGLRFNEKNVNGQCLRCNYHLRGNQAHYREGLVRKYGEAEVKRLEDTAAAFKRTGYKWDRNVLIDIILKYR